MLAYLANGEGESFLRGCLANAEGETFLCRLSRQWRRQELLLRGPCRQCRRRDLLVACLANGEGETFSYVARVRSCNANASGGLNFLASGYDGFHAKTNPLCE